MRMVYKQKYNKTKAEMVVSFTEDSILEGVLTFTLPYDANEAAICWESGFTMDEIRDEFKNKVV